MWLDSWARLTPVWPKIEVSNLMADWYNGMLLVDLIMALGQSHCRIPNYVSPARVHSPPTKHGELCKSLQILLAQKPWYHMIFQHRMIFPNRQTALVICIANLRAVLNTAVRIQSFSAGFKMLAIVLVWRHRLCNVLAIAMLHWMIVLAWFIRVPSWWQRCR